MWQTDNLELQTMLLRTKQKKKKLLRTKNNVRKKQRGIRI